MLRSLKSSLRDSPMRRLANLLLRCDNSGENLPVELRDQMNAFSDHTIDDFQKKAGRFMHNLDVHQKEHGRVHVHTEQEVEKLIDLFPSSLTYLDDRGKLPVQAINKSKKFIPLLAHKGMIRDVGGKGMRGGLLCEIPRDRQKKNTLQSIANTFNFKAIETHDKELLGILQSLYKRGLLVKKDIQDMSLLSWAIYPTSQRRFHFLASLDPIALKKTKWKGVPLIHQSITMRLSRGSFEDYHSFEMVLKCGVEHYPDKLGFLFRKYKGKTACEVAIEKFGKDIAMACIRRCIPQSSENPILHHAMASVPNLMTDFIVHFPEATYLRNKYQNNRSLFQAILASGSKTFGTDPYFFMSATDLQIAEKDPFTGVFPFMLAAADSNSDLDGVFTLLRRNPDVIELSRYESGRLNSKFGEAASVKCFSVMTRLKTMVLAGPEDRLLVPRERYSFTAADNIVLPPAGREREDRIAASPSSGKYPAPEEVVIRPIEEFSGNDVDTSISSLE